MICMICTVWYACSYGTGRKRKKRNKGDGVDGVGRNTGLLRTEGLVREEEWGNNSRKRDRCYEVCIDYVHITLLYMSLYISHLHF